MSLIDFCLQQDYVEIYRVIHQRGYNINMKDKEGNTPLIIVSKNNDTYLVNLFLQYKANPLIHNLYGKSAIDYICEHGNREVIKVIIEHKYIVRRKRGKIYERMMQMLAWYGHQNCLRLLINAGVNIDCEDKNGETPLFKACGNNKLDCVELLLRFGANINKRDNYRNNPLHVCCDNLHFDCIELLLSQHNVKSNNMRQNRETPHDILFRNILALDKYVKNVSSITQNAISFDNDYGFRYITLLSLFRANYFRKKRERGQCQI